MSMLNMMETRLPEFWSKAIYDDKGFDLGASVMADIAKTFFIGTSEALKSVKSKEYPVAFVYEDNNLEFIIAAIVRFIPSEDESMPGHWNYVWTFDNADIPDNARRISIADVSFHSYFRMVCGQFNFGFKGPEEIISLGVYTMKAISKWLSDNAKEDEETGITLEGTFQARAIVEDHEVYKSLELIGETKAIIKDDAGVEV